MAVKRASLVMWAVWLGLVMVAAGCAANAGQTVVAGAGGDDLSTRAARAVALLDAPQSLDVAAGRQAWETLWSVADEAAADDPDRFEFIVQAARAGLWLATYVEPEDGALVGRVLALTNTAVSLKPERVEGHHYRAVVLGLVARQDPLKGPDAMKSMVADGRKAAQIDGGFEQGGPHRLLGGLYLKAPGPPTGVGSPRRALHHLKKAVELAPQHPGNLVLLAQAHQAVDAPTEAAALLERFEALDASAHSPVVMAYWRGQAQETRKALTE